MDASLSGNTTPSPSPRVMLVDDHELWRAVVRRLLEAAGIEVVAEAANGDDVIDLAVRHRPTVILLDIGLPDFRGTQLVGELARRLPRSSVVMLSAASDDRDVVDCLENGAVGYLTKDIPPDALIRAVRDSANGHLPMSRPTAARALRHFVALARLRPAASPGDARLTLRQQEILRGVADGLSDREIARQLTISPRTVEGHMRVIIRRLHARDRSDAAARYYRSTVLPSATSRS